MCWHINQADLLYRESLLDIMIMHLNVLSASMKHGVPCNCQYVQIVSEDSGGQQIADQHPNQP